jgi:Mn-dependent DtxR family transcriptional regulator
MAEVARFLDVHPSTVSKMIERYKLAKVRS